MTMIEIVSKSKAKYIVPIKSILYLEEWEGAYYVYLPNKFVVVEKNQFDAIIHFLEESNND